MKSCKNREIVHLHNHSNHSFLDGQASIKNMIVRAQELGLDTLAITNHGNIFAHIEFYQTCKKAGIKPILGSEFYLTDAHDNKNRHAHHLVVLPENYEGWLNICRLTTAANRNFYYKPRIDLADLERYKEGLIVLTACMHGPVSYWLFDKMTWPVVGEESKLKEAANIPEAYRFANELKRIMGPSHLFLEVQDGGIPEQLLINERVRKMAGELGLFTIATQDAHYVNQDDAEAHSFLKAMAFGKVAAEAGSHGFSTQEFYLKSRDQVLSGDILEVEVNRTQEIADRCNVELPLYKMRLPKYPDDSGRPSIELLRDRLLEGWKRLGIKDKNGVYAARVKYELADIEEAGLADYFLIVNDITNYCRDHDIMVGPGRGSVGGSLVSFLLGITNIIDPIHYGLIWERFYNAGRKGSMPDIDTDVEKSRREEVLQFIRDRFGDDRVAQLVALSSMGPKQVLRDVLKVAGIEQNTINLVSGLVPAKGEDHGSISLKEALDTVPKLREYAENDDEMLIERGGRVIRKTSWKELFDHARRLEGCYRTTTIHAAAVVISDCDFDRAGIPLVKGATKDNLICGWDMDSIDAFGFLKVDILGIATLDVMRSTFKLIKERHGVELTVDQFPLDDPKVFQMLGEGRAQGVFQLESHLGKAWAKKCQPKSIEEIAELTAIIRPACLDTGMAETYAKIKKGEESPSYIHPILKPILEPTKGILLYQEQVIEICQVVAQMNLRDADAVRKTVGKKKPDELRAKEAEFMKGAIETVGEEIAEKIWSWIEKQAGYGFNKSHAIGYGMIAYQTAWLKANYFLEFMCANLMHAKDRCGGGRTPQEFIAQVVNDGKLMNVEVIPPKLGRSEDDFSILDDHTISFGFSHIHGVGATAMKSVRASSKAKSFDEFVQLTHKHKMKKNVIDALICSGALDDYGIARRAMRAEFTLLEGLTAKEWEGIMDYEAGSPLARIRMMVTEELVEKHKAEKKRVPNVKRRAKIRDLLDEYTTCIPHDTVAQILMWEKKYLGATLSGSLADLNRAMSGARHTCKQIGSNELSPGSKMDLCVVVENIKELTIKRGAQQGRQMAMLSLSDSSYTIEGVCAFADTYDKMRVSNIAIGDVVSVTGRVGDRGPIAYTIRLL